MIALIAAMDEARLIGVGGRLPWHSSADMAHFRALTMGHIVAGGSGTWESIGKKLDNRLCVTLSRDPVKGSTLQCATNMPWWFVPVGWFPSVFIIGGASIYEQALPMADRLYLTRIRHTFPACDGAVYFPEWDGFRLVGSKHREADAANPWPMDFEQWERG